MRPVALGRKNWLHIGSPQAGPKVAATLSVVESCRRLKISIRDYLAAILPGMAAISRSGASQTHPHCLGHAVFVKPRRTAQKFSSSVERGHCVPAR
jgi:hypothetical protein